MAQPHLIRANVIRLRELIRRRPGCGVMCFSTYCLSRYGKYVRLINSLRVRRPLLFAYSGSYRVLESLRTSLFFFTELIICPNTKLNMGLITIEGPPF